MADDRIDGIVRISKEVILDCVCTNGAIIAANPLHPAYPQSAKDYRFVWPRDGAFSCMALDLIGVRDVQERFFSWCEHAQGFSKTGLFFEKYYVSGRKALNNFQPDQTGTLLVAVHHHVNKWEMSPENFRGLVHRAADGICSVWKKDHFTRVATDLWEERQAFPDLSENFTYSTAACIKGLLCAHEMFGVDEWLAAAREMEDAVKGYFFERKRLGRSFGKFCDSRIDASLLGLAWPFEVLYASDPVVLGTVHEIESRLLNERGVMRYEGDDYDGWMYGRNVHRKKGAGAWPLLTLWLSIYHSLAGNRREALRYFELAVPDGYSYIPEQVFDNGFQKSVCPLAWSHAMAVIALEKLGKL